jgi:2-oxo-4-hydroxy-4-carboxy--5-ureidoimidazoline (OHCU) decarboxylase
VICARRNKKEAMLRAFPQRLTHSREMEIATALDQIFQIASFRLDEVLP